MGQQIRRTPMFSPAKLVPATTVVGMNQPSDDQLGLHLFDDLDLDAHRSPWWKWHQGIGERVDQLFAAAREYGELPADIDRYCDTAIEWLSRNMFAALFPNREAVQANPRLSDLFATWIGECFVHRANGEWVDKPGAGGDLYTEFGPAVRFDHTTELLEPVEMLGLVSDPFLTQVDEHPLELLVSEVRTAQRRAQG